MEEKIPESNSNNRKERTEILTLRIPIELKNQIEEISNRMHSKKSRISQNYLNLSDIMIVREDNTKIGWDNDPLCIYPQSIMKEIFSLMSGDINDNNRFSIMLNLGDKVGQYLSNLYTLMGVEDSNFKKMFEIIKHLGWFSYTLVDETIVIPKDFWDKPFIYAMLYRIITKQRFPPDWDTALLEKKYPFPLNTGEKKERQQNQTFEQRYSTIQKTLDPDLEKERTLNYYFFKNLKVSAE